MGITLTLEEIRHIPKEAWKLRIQNKSIELAIAFLNSNQGRKSQQKEELEMSPYLKSNIEDVSVQTASFIAKIQSHMVENIKLNYKEQYKPNLICDSCKISECDQKHLLECSELIGTKQISFIHSQLY